MCGFVGQLTYEGGRDPAAARAALSPLLALAARRGPDGEGWWGDAHCTLGFRRLAILDLSDNAQQPMRSVDGRYALVYNGALYNFHELRRELEGRGVRFRSTGDTEVVLYALATWGTRALERFNGMFALAFYDARERRLLLARDHAGMKPLYYMEAAGGVVFASQYDQILAHPWGQGRASCAEALGLYLRLGYVPAPYAVLQGTHSVTAGEWIEFAAGKTPQRGRFFEFPLDRQPDLSGAAAVEALEAAVGAAVKRHLLADVPVGVFLSGGIDSPLVAATMGALGTTPLRAFTLGTGGDQYDESAAATAYAEEIGAQQVVVQFTPEHAAGMVDDVAASCAEPFADYSIFPTMFVSEVARRDVTVVLSGDGGDELFWGYPSRFAEPLRRIASQQWGAGDDRRWNLARLLKFGSLQSDPRWPASLGDLHRLCHTRGSEGWLQRIFPALPAWPDDFALFRFAEWDADRAAQWLRWNEYYGHLAMVLQKVDRGSMFQALEVRAPLLDREVIDVATRLPWRECLDAERMVGKLPLRYALARRVQRQTWAKRGFTVPMAAWLRSTLRPLFLEAVLEREVLAGLEMRRDAVRELFEHHLNGADHGWLLWVLLSLALWQRRHFGG